MRRRETSRALGAREIPAGRVVRQTLSGGRQLIGYRCDPCVEYDRRRKARALEPKLADSERDRIRVWRKPD
jgi:hypothetical protein